MYPPAGPASNMEKSVLKIMDVEIGKGGAGDKAPVYIVKQSYGKKVFQFLMLAAIVVGVYLFTTTYYLKQTKRHYSQSQHEAMVDRALARMKLVEVSSDLQSHLVAEVQEKHEAIFASEQVLEEIQQQEEESKTKIVEWFQGLHDSVRGELDDLESVLGSVIKDADDLKMVKEGLTKTRGQMQTKFDEAHENVLEILVPLYDVFDEFISGSVEDVRAHGDAAAERLDAVNEDLTHDTLQAAEANTKLAENFKNLKTTHLKDGEMKAMVDNFLTSFQKELGNHHSEELGVLEMSKRLVSAYDPHLVGALKPGMLEKLLSLKDKLDTGIIEADSLSKILNPLMQTGAIPAPPNADMGVSEYIQALIDVNHKLAKDKAAIHKRADTVEAKKKLLGEILAQKMLYQSKAMSLEKFYNMIVTAVKQGEIPATWLVKANSEEEDHLTWKQRVKQNQAVIKAKKAAGTAETEVDTSVENTVVDASEAAAEAVRSVDWKNAKVNRTESPLAKRHVQHRHQEVQMDAETSDWLKSTYDSLTAGQVTPGQFYKEIMDKYNEGKIGYDTMSRFTKQMRQFAPKGKRASRRANAGVSGGATAMNTGTIGRGGHPATGQAYAAGGQPHAAGGQARAAGGQGYAAGAGGQGYQAGAAGAQGYPAGAGAQTYPRGQAPQGQAPGGYGQQQAQQAQPQQQGAGGRVSSSSYNPNSAAQGGRQSYSGR